MRGRGYCYLDSQRVELHTGSLVLLDCYLPHRYGYGSDSTFCTTFKRITGMTPLEYRNQR
ncbi:MAG: AraC family transcriptional regulator [Clostridiales bacterium]|nr:AraC family transcriptional regulator [Clostridiales bacterium]MDY5514410.1 AraC family transcriptional regulator [Candidatus Ventricola sp.]